MRSGANEIEVKLAVKDAKNFTKKILSLGFRESKPRIFEANVTFDTDNLRLRQSDQLLRIRETGNGAVLTWKGPSEPGIHKSRPEVECSVSDPANLRRIFQELGYAPRFRYEKYRTEYEGDSGGVITFDETPIGYFVELEGLPDWIDRTAEVLGFDKSDYVLESYGTLYRKFCTDRGIKPTDMLFQTS